MAKDLFAGPAPGAVGSIGPMGREGDEGCANLCAALGERGD
ncbi:hypothetical protein ACPOL_3826 [Acidisarcina polymorpha]|uniref:Uncharacterized protein n=1 Tax=Acidisarcina polymorpha TaxID=2211140 RepID=A0A2Z5G3A1_9BACT|nr:hypothetical protein ACPOL_3826 [Acidisarcina polymorpha]